MDECIRTPYLRFLEYGRPWRDWPGGTTYMNMPTIRPLVRGIFDALGKEPG